MTAKIVKPDWASPHRSGTGFDYAIWYGLWVPAGTPVGVVEKLAKDIARARFVQGESESAARIIKAADIKPE